MFKHANNKGFILISFYMVVTVLVILSSSFAIRSIGEQRAASKARDVIESFWLAEAGLNRAVSTISTTPLSGLSATMSLSGSIGIGAYDTIIEPVVDPITGSQTGKFLITSTGGVPGTNTSDPNNAIRKASAIVEKPLLNAVTSAITANGNVDVKGSAQVNGAIAEYATFNFDDIFSMSKETLKNNAVHVYTDPENNITPVNQTTWVNLDTATEMKITETGWSGSGILVVDGDLTITGGHFEGIIWVIGALRVSGNPIIDGSIYVESGAEVETDLTGNPTVSFDGDAVGNAFSWLPAHVLSWKED